MFAIQVTTPGGPEAMRYLELPDLRPGPGQVLVRIAAVGVNFLDVYHRTGLYPLPAPFTPGSEASGTVEEIGEGVTEFAPGDRVVYSHIGSYADLALVPAARLVGLPQEIDFRTAAASFLQGLTAHYLVNSTFPTTSQHTVLVHAAAGGVGGVLVQMAKAKGARVIGTASTGKVSVARDAGADLVIDYTKEEFAERVLAETQGEGVHVVFDSVGKTTFDGSLESLRTRGMLVSFGQSSGPVPPFDVLRLSRKALFLTRPSLVQYTSDREELRWRASDLFASITSGAVRIHIGTELPLREAGEAHRRLENRETTGKIVLIP